MESQPQNPEFRINPENFHTRMAPGQNWGKMIDLTSKFGEINNIEHNKGSKIYPQNQGIAKHAT